MSSPRASCASVTPALRKSVHVAPAGDELAVMTKEGVRILALVGHVAPLRIDHRQPRTAAREAPIAGPLHRVAGTVPAGAIDGWIGSRPVDHPDLLALVDEGRARQAQEQLRGLARVL